MVLEASPVWQNAFLVGVLAAAGWCVWSGWRMGIVRALFSLAGMLVACVVDILISVFVGAIAIAVAPIYGALAGVFAGALAALASYVLVMFLGALLFKRTAQQPTSLLRLIYGFGGAVVGVFVGVTVFWCALLFVRGTGGICEPSIEDRNGIYSLPIPKPVARALVKLKRSVEAGDTGKTIESLDVMPQEYYRIMEKFGRLLVDPGAVRRFVSYPGIYDVLVDMRFSELINDPEVQELARAQNATALIRNPKMLDAMKDPGLIGKLQKIDIEKALDYALSAPAPKNSHHP